MLKVNQNNIEKVRNLFKEKETKSNRVEEAINKLKYVDLYEKCPSIFVEGAPSKDEGLQLIYYKLDKKLLQKYGVNIVNETIEVGKVKFVKKKDDNSIVDKFALKVIYNVDVSGMTFKIEQYVLFKAIGIKNNCIELLLPLFFGVMSSLFVSYNDLDYCFGRKIFNEKDVPINYLDFVKNVKFKLTPDYNERENTYDICDYKCVGDKTKNIFLEFLEDYTESIIKEDLADEGKIKLIGNKTNRVERMTIKDNIKMDTINYELSDLIRGHMSLDDIKATKYELHMQVEGSDKDFVYSTYFAPHEIKRVWTLGEIFNKLVQSYNLTIELHSIRDFEDRNCYKYDTIGGIFIYNFEPYSYNITKYEREYFVNTIKENILSHDKQVNTIAINDSNIPFNNIVIVSHKTKDLLMPNIFEIKTGILNVVDDKLYILSKYIILEDEEIYGLTISERTDVAAIQLKNKNEGYNHFADNSDEDIISICAPIFATYDVNYDVCKIACLEDIDNFILNNNLPSDYEGIAPWRILATDISPNEFIKYFNDFEIKVERNPVNVREFKLSENIPITAIFDQLTYIMTEEAKIDTVQKRILRNGRITGVQCDHRIIYVSNFLIGRADYIYKDKYYLDIEGIVKPFYEHDEHKFSFKLNEYRGFDSTFHNVLNVGNFEDIVCYTETFNKNYYIKPYIELLKKYLVSNVE